MTISSDAFAPCFRPLHSASGICTGLEVGGRIAVNRLDHAPSDGAISDVPDEQQSACTKRPDLYRISICCIGCGGRLMDRPAGASGDGCPGGDLDRRLKLEVHGSRVASGAGLLASRELDDGPGLADPASAALSKCRRGKNTRHLPTGLFP
jgi:hypothetical protein